MRTKHSSRNFVAAMATMGITLLLGFFTRKLFVDLIGVEYLGLNGLLSNILAAVTLLESGFGISVTYNLYKPLAEGNKKQIVALLQLYKRVYRWIAVAVFSVCLILYPFLGFFIRDSKNIDYISIVYAIFVFNALIPYFTAYKWSLINTDQRNYKLAGVNISYQLLTTFAKLAILYYTHNYILYLLTDSLLLLLLNVGIVWTVNRLYPYILTKARYTVSPEIKRNIIKNVKALIFAALGGYFMYSTSNIIISKYVSLAAVGLYSNYTLITSSVEGLGRQILNSSSESVGNLIASESKEKVYEIFKPIMLLNFMIVTAIANALLLLFNPFIAWWLGKEYCFPYMTVFLIVAYYLISNLRISAFTFKMKAGIFQQDKYTPLLQGLINVILALLLVQYLDLDGVILGMFLSILAIGFWQTPRLIYKYVFQKPLIRYFLQYGLYLGIGIIAHFISLPIARIQVVDNALLQLMYIGLVAICIPTLAYMVFLYRTPAMKNMIDHLLIVFHKGAR